MRASVVLIYGNDARLTALLEGTVLDARCVLRHPRDPKECLEELAGAAPAVLILKVGRDLEEEMKLLADVGERCPSASTVVVVDPAQSALAGLAWDLGAAYVMILPQPREMLQEIVLGLLKTPEGDAP